MSIVRTRLTFEDHYATVPNRWVRDGRLSLKARGLLAQILSHRIGWRVSITTLVSSNPEGRDAIRGAILELEEHGYLTRHQHVDGSTGKFGSAEYVLSDPWADAPWSDNPSTVSPAETEQNPRSEPLTGFPTSGEPSSDNPPYKKTISREDHSSSSEVATAPVRPEIEALCTRLADRIESNGSKRPTVTKTWRDAARLMLDRDGRTVAQIEWLIDWSQNDEFWRTNILSMPKLRAQFDQLRLKSTASSTVSTPAPSELPSYWRPSNERHHSHA